jgi:hypothetical protein
LPNEQFDDYDHFIRMKSTLLMDAKDIEENIESIQKQILSSSTSIVNNTNQQYSSRASIPSFENHQTSVNVDNLHTTYFKSISTTT